MNGDIKQKVLDLANDVAEGQGLQIFDIELLGRGRILLRVIIDRESGVTLDDCERFSKAFGAALDVENPLPRSYNLEVSSPGLDRPLRKLKDFEKNIGKLARITTAEKIENQNFLIGRITEVSDDSVRLMIKELEINIPFDKISKARLEIEL